MFSIIKFWIKKFDKKIFQKNTKIFERTVAEVSRLFEDVFNFFEFFWICFGDLLIKTFYSIF